MNGEFGSVCCRQQSHHLKHLSHPVCRSSHQDRLPWVYHQARIIWSRACATVQVSGLNTKEEQFNSGPSNFHRWRSAELAHARNWCFILYQPFSNEFPASEFDSVRGTSSPPSKWENLLCSLCADMHHNCLRRTRLESPVGGHVQSNLAFLNPTRPQGGHRNAEDVGTQCLILYITAGSNAIESKLRTVTEGVLLIAPRNRSL